MSLHARALLGPGPSNPYPEATAALGHPLLGHLDPVFLGILDETSERLRRVFGRSLARHGGAAAAAELLERLAARRSPVLRASSPWS